ncbi:MAG: hypothetical protein ACO3F2_04260 [Roseiflexaceae bacterium]
MSTRITHVVEISSGQSHVVVLSNQRLMFQSEDARDMLIDGVRLSVVSGAQLWQWQTYRRVGQHVLVIHRDTSIQIVSIECIDKDVHQSFVDTLRDQLHAIDARLCMGNSAWHSLGFSLSNVESLLGMTCDTMLQVILRAMDAPPINTLHEWRGDTPNHLRIDRVIVREETVIPYVYEARMHHNHQEYMAMLVQFLDVIEPVSHSELREHIRSVRQRILSPLFIHHTLAQYINHAYQALSVSRRAMTQGELQHTADVALLYERWVWIMVLKAMGCDDMRIGQLIDGDRTFVSQTGVTCAYQRRLLPMQTATGWSRDGRVAIPDVMLWQTYGENCCRALILDAKCSMATNAPTANALNDITAYLRRIGIGDADPDVAVLVHPGDEIQRWPSGVVVLGTNGLDTHMLDTVVHKWITNEI